jgi:hypothetical protein
MPHSSEPRLLVLHGLKLKGFAEPDAVAGVVGLEHTMVERLLAALVQEGSAIRRDGRISGFALTAAGRAAHAAGLVAEAEALGHRSVVDEQYRRFLVLNSRLLEVCTAWQVKDLSTNTLNDHTDPAYDAAVVDRLVEIHEQVQPICTSLTSLLVRYSPYSARFTSALVRVRNGEQAWFAKPIIDSYHTVWMEMHEDLLATLSLDRASESAH